MSSDCSESSGNGGGVGLVLQRVHHVRPAPRDDEDLFVYELRTGPDGPVVCHSERGLFEAITQQPSYRAALRKMMAPVELLLTDEAGYCSLRVSALWASERPPELFQI